jgi:hypothetical protein
VRGTWIVKDFSGATVGDTTGRGAWQLVKHAYGLSGQQAAEKLAKISGVSLQLTQHTEGGNYLSKNGLFACKTIHLRSFVYLSGYKKESHTFWVWLNLHITIRIEPNSFLCVQTLKMNRF